MFKQMINPSPPGHRRTVTRNQISYQLTTRKHMPRTLTIVFTLSFFVLAGGAAADTLDLSSNFDQASDFTTPNEEYNPSGTVTSSVTDDNGGVQFQTTRNGTGGASYHSTMSSATFNPSTQGAITDINWSNDVRQSLGIGASAGQTLPLILQGGTLYVYKGKDMNPSNAIAGNCFYNYNEAGTWLVGQFIDDVVVASDFEELLTSPGTWAGGAGGGPGSTSSSNPDFTISGGEITFGYLMANTGGSPRVNKTVMRNAAMSVEYTPIPEPNSFFLAALGLLGLGRRRRRLGAGHGRTEGKGGMMNDQ